MEKIDLTKGDITKSLLKLSLPIIATNFIQMAYGMIDMIWIGRVGSGAVAAIGTASFFINLAMALFTLIVIGTGVKISHAVGRGEEKEGKDYIANGFILSITLALLYIIFIFTFKNKLIGFYELGNVVVENMAKNYLVISSIGIIFMYFNSLLTTIFNSYGESKMPFRANTIGFIFNIVLDPILIFGFGPIKPLGVFGAALATLIARIVVFTMFLRISKGRFSFLRKGIKLNIKKAKEVIHMGLPIAAQRVIFTLISIIIAKIIANWGATAIAVQKVGVQIESISYITIGGLQGAIAAFVGQNYGAKKEERIKLGYYKALKLTIIFGFLVTLTFFIFSKQIFGIFLSENEALNMGNIYMKILGLSQVFMCMELLTVGAFNGIGKTYAPPIISIIFSGLRIPMAMFLSNENLFGLNGVWMSISVSSLFKGTILVTWFLIELKKLKFNIKER
ncbi:putative MATE family efflux protein [Clostridium moniliforme]|uniref:Probable multidrug resistance protein NorM n=1 Tax=Clostridium moniliforme TaxID=39489 RepID=A0ABS4EXF2_9CLOT|nr:MATE family efflux transporter [Clostridium moniliforme]MBP1888678.1 putative MATE family efflux protein [Clostridium moniliforme]